MAKNKEPSAMETLLAKAIALPVKAGPISGCGRAYVCFSGEKDQIKEVAKAAKVLNRIFQKKAYGVGDNALYVGYDNATGRGLAQARAMADFLNSQGVPCYMDAAGD